MTGTLSRACQAVEGVRDGGGAGPGCRSGRGERGGARPERGEPSRRAVTVIIVLATVVAALVLTGLGSKSLVRDEMA